MKTLVDIDNQLMEKAMKLSRMSTKKETINKALEEFIKLKSREQLKKMAGSGMTSWRLRDLRTARLRREREQALLMKAGR